MRICSDNVTKNMGNALSLAIFLFVPACKMFEILAPSEGELRDRGSKFFAYAFPVKSVEEVAQCLAPLRKRYFDATHHCYAYRLGSDGATCFVNDDGEPAHSAGTPILAAIRSANLTNTLVVVVRYFGGTKLGVRGLIEAYREAAEDALAQAARQEIIPRTAFTIEYAYDRTTDVNRIMHRVDALVLAAEYTDTCRQRVAVRVEAFAAIEKAFVSVDLPLTDIAPFEA